MTCKLEGCTKTLTKGQRKFCCEGHSNDYYQAMRKSERLKQKKDSSLIRFCAYEECCKEIPKETHIQKKYCPDTDCSYKQNQLDQRRRRAEAKKNKVIEIVECANDKCSEKIEKHHRRKYCCANCRRAQNQRDFTERRETEVMQYEMAKEEAEQLNGNRKSIKISPEYLTRGQGFERSEIKEKTKKENKNFSARWLGDLWDNIKEEYLSDKREIA